MVNLSEVYLAEIQYKCGLSELKYSLVCGLKKMGWSSISFMTWG